MGWNRRTAVVALHDIAMAALSFELALGLRYALDGNPQPPLFLWEGTLLFTLAAAVVFSATGLYRGIWHYASFRDLVAIARAVTLALLVFLPLLFLVTRLEQFPRSVLLIQWPLLVALLAGPRILYRAWKDGNFSLVFERADESQVPVLVAGAGRLAETFIRDLKRRRDAGYRVVGLVDDKEARQGRDIHGIRVLGGFDAIPAVVERLDRQGRRPRRLIIAAEQIDGATVQRLLDTADKLGMTLARVPRLTDFRRDDGAAPPLRPVDVEDLLGRPQKVLDREAMRRLVGGRRVLVTGAGGTIGAELARQVAELGPAALTLYDNGEFNLYQIDLELGERWPALARRAVLGDVRAPLRLDQVFGEARPELVFHAAALKHVPLAEANPSEAALTNVAGTRAVADACLKHGVRAMVLISTDKAVNPTSVMGATKRIAEMVAQALSVAEARRGGATHFVTVRFGNVLGSTGSVVPLFQRQLARGGPLTVTHPEVTRYFMTTREAVELILQAAAQPDLRDAEEGKIFVLDMGEPVRIQDLARQMIRLAGLRPDIDVAVAFTGLRPGEKLHEELLHAQERLVPTRQEGILLAAPRLVDRGELYGLIEQLAAAAEARDEARTLALIARLVPEFRPEGAVPAAAAG
jgi:O-antigen biosynthesis protein WbqV